MATTPSTAWQRVARDIADRIMSGETAVGSKINTHQELTRRHETSLGTVKRAIEHLQTRGILQGMQGAGVFVQRLPTAEDLEFGEQARSDGDRIAHLEGKIREVEERLAQLERKQ